MSNLILIDQSVPDKDFIISNKLYNTEYLQIDAIKQSFNDIYIQIEQLNITTPITNIGLIKVNDFRFFDLNTVNIEVNDPNLDHLEEFINFLNNLKNKFGMINFDIITCNLYNDDWKYIIDTVKNKHNITIRTSSNITGKYGDWLLESDGTSLVGLYFNEDINNYQYSLDLSFHTIIMDDSFNLWGCGYNIDGELGTGDNTSKNTLTLMTGISGKTPIQAACGYDHTIVLMSDGSIYSCGYNDYGQLGTGNTTNTNTLTLMTGISGKTPIQVACGIYHTTVLMSDGTIYGCGYNIVGQLGTGDTLNTNTLTLMTGISGKTPIQVACGVYYTIVLMSDGTIYGCGYNFDGELGTGDTLDTNTLTLMTGISGKTPIQVACGGYHTTVLMSDGSIYSCGYNNVGQLGTGDTLDTNTLTLMTGISGKTPIQVACGIYHTTVLMSDGTIYGCGYNIVGQLGTGDTLNTNTLTLMTAISGKTPIQVACGCYNTIVLMSDGSIYGCGYNRYGQLGTGDTTNTDTLTAMIRPANMTTPILLQGHIYENNPISDICFPAGTPVNCDQGIIAIDKIDPKIHTIRGNEIIEVTKTITQDDYLVCIDKDAFNLNVPSQKTIMTQKHEVFYNGYMVRSNDLLGKVENVYKVKYTGEILYNILLKNHSLMKVNNLICETLNPNIYITKMLLELKEQNIYQKQHFIRNFNESFTRSEIMAN
jgi:alpha-tubulin suppressor-like RCC1 family protein